MMREALGMHTILSPNAKKGLRTSLLLMRLTLRLFCQVLGSSDSKRSEDQREEWRQLKMLGI